MAGLPTALQGMKLVEWFVQGENARKTEIDESVRELCYSIVANGLLQALVAIDHGSHGVLVCGNRRFAAINWGISQGLAVPKQVPVLLYPPTTTPSQIKVIQLTENIQRVDLTDPEIFRTCQALLELNPDWKLQDLAKHLNKDASTVTRYTSPKSLIPEALEAFLDGKFGFAKAYAIAKLATDQQGGMLALTLNGATRDELERQGRKKRGAAAPAVRASKIPIRLTGGVTVTVSGEELSLDDAIEAIKDATKEMVKGRDQGLDARTLVAVCRDKAKAGG